VDGLASAVCCSVVSADRAQCSCCLPAVASLTVISIQAEFFLLRVRHLSIHCWNVPSHMIPTNNCLSVSYTKSQRVAYHFLPSLGSAISSLVLKNAKGFRAQLTKWTLRLHRFIAPTCVLLIATACL
jgi:hypothetical protein